MSNTHSGTISRLVGKAEQAAGRAMHDGELIREGRLREQLGSARNDSKALDDDAAMHEDLANLESRKANHQIIEQRLSTELIDEQRRAAMDDLSAETDERLIKERKIREKVADQVKQVNLNDLLEDDKEARMKRAGEYIEARRLQEQAQELRK